MEYVDASGADTPLPAPDSLTTGTLLKINSGGADPEYAIVDSVVSVFLQPPPTSGTPAPGSTPPPTRRIYQVTFRDLLDKGVDRGTASPVLVESEEFNLTIQQGAAGTPKTYNFLATDPLHPRYAPTYVNALDLLIRLEETDPPPAGGPDKALPAAGAGIALVGPAGPAPPVTIKDVIQAGVNEDISALPTTPQVFIDALATLEKVRDVNNVAVPDVAIMKFPADATGIQQAIIAHCENMGDRFGVLDAFAPDQDLFADTPKTSSTLPSIETQRNKLDSGRGYAALYYPWIRVLPASRGPLVSVPPSGHMCGLYARVDTTRGVHKAPANEPLTGAVAITRDMSNVDQGVLNLQGINVIRTFTNGGQPIAFGARTTTADTNWQYVNVRRLFLFLERSISDNLRASVFEPNNTALWGSLNRTISAFLLEQWHNGALFGDKPDSAFYVKIDESINPFTDRQLGKLTIEIGVQPTYPAEFIIVRIGIWDGGAAVQES